MCYTLDSTVETSQYSTDFAAAIEISWTCLKAGLSVDVDPRENGATSVVMAYGHQLAVSALSL